MEYSNLDKVREVLEISSVASSNDCEIGRKDDAESSSDFGATQQLYFPIGAAE